MTYVQHGVVMTRRRQALVMLYMDKHRRLGYGSRDGSYAGLSRQPKMSPRDWTRYQEWINAFLKPYGAYDQ